jgi:aryl-phospho-beta-D-glucosidase BglC (GH1 family)
MEGRGTLVNVVALGFRHLRLPIDPSHAVIGMQRGPDVALRMVDRLAGDIAAAQAQKLAVILDMHPPDTFRERLRTVPGEAERFAKTWAVIARSLAALDPESLILEVLNEPGEALGLQWHELQAKLVQAIRAEAPQHTILVTGANFSTVSDLRQLDPLQDNNLIYSFHSYTPMLFTHQGAEWAPPYARISGVPYPLRATDVRAFEAAAPTMDRPQIAEEARDGAGWDSTALDVLLAEAGEWSKQRKVPLVCTEFGVYRDGGVKPADRLRYLADMRTSLSRHTQAWTVWDYSGGFGVVRRRRNGIHVDRAMLRALGLA